MPNAGKVRTLKQSGSQVFAINLATLSFGARRGLLSFLGIGLFGGLLAALMPLSKGNVALRAALYNAKIMGDRVFSPCADESQ